MHQEEFEYPDLKVKWVKNLRIPMRDGITLGADVCFPCDNLMREMGWKRLPVVMEYIPYRKNESVPGARFSEELVRCGYIVVRVDLRGTGDSEGFSTDEYLPVEQQDGYDTVEWLAQQPWCDGQINIMGISYGGFTALQIASLQPPHLRTIIPIDFTDNRYTDDCHYYGGLLRMYYDVAFYGNQMVVYNAMPPSAAWLDEDWERIWAEHLEKNEPYIIQWLEHQVDGSYWRNGSVEYCPQAIQVPVFMFGGWRDGYPNPPLRLYQALQVPRKVLIGPWNHSWPNKAIPGPRIDFIHEVSRWLDYWCKSIGNGIMDEPPVQVFMQEYQPPIVDRLETTGRWRGESDYPPPGFKQKCLFLGNQNTLSPQWSGAAGNNLLTYYPQAGTSGGLWSGGIMFGLPGDQRPDEVYSLLYSTDPLAQDLAILGTSHVELFLSSSSPVMGYVAKLCDVAPDGTSALIAKGAMNITRRNSLSQPQPVEPDEVVRLEIPMDCTGWIFRKGHCIRLAISNSDFPNLWPTPETGISWVYSGEEYPSSLILPVVPLEGVSEPDHFLPSSRRVTRHSDNPEPPIWETTTDMLSGVVTYRIGFKSNIMPDPKTHIYHESEGVYTIDPNHPEKTCAQGRYGSIIKQPGLEVRGISNLSIHSTLTDFHLQIDLDVHLNGKLKYHKEWNKTIPRNLL